MAAFLPEHLESINCRQIREWPILRVQVRISLQKHIAEGGTEVGPINIEVLLARHVDLLAFGAVGFDSRCGELL